jgi:hypothetical protein
MGVLFTRNHTGKDWYELVKELPQTGYTYVLVDDAGIVNHAVNDPDFMFPNERRLLRVSEVAQPITLIGLKFNEDGTFAAPPPPPVIRVSKAQAKLALLDAGLLEQVESIIANHTYAAIRIWYADSNDWDRNSPYVAAIAIELGIDESVIDDLFRAASRK